MDRCFLRTLPAIVLKYIDKSDDNNPNCCCAPYTFDCSIILCEFKQIYIFGKANLTLLIDHTLLSCFLWGARVFFCQELQYLTNCHLSSKSLTLYLKKDKILIDKI